MTFLKPHKLILLICVVFFMFLFSCSGKEEQYKRDLDFVTKEYKIFLELEKKETEKIEKKIEDCYISQGLKGQYFVKKFNRINSIIDLGLKEFDRPSNENLNFEKIDSVQHKVIRKVTEELTDDKQEKKFLESASREHLLKFMDSCLKVKNQISPGINLYSKKMELLVLKNAINAAFGNSCGRLSINCFFSPFSGRLIIKNYQKNKLSFLEIKFPDDINENSLKNLRFLNDKNYEDTLTISSIKIGYGLNLKKQSDSSFFRIDLSKLKPGKYKLDACTKLVKPDTKKYSSDNTSPVYCELIEFEVFQ